MTSQLVFLSLQLPFACACAFYKLKGRGKVRGAILLFLRALSICQTIPVALGISLLIKSIQPDQSNLNNLYEGDGFSAKSVYKKLISLSKGHLAMVGLASFDFWKALLDFSTHVLLVQILFCEFAYELVTLDYFCIRSRYAVKVILASRVSSAQE